MATKSSHQLLDTVYEELDYYDGVLLDATALPPAPTETSAAEIWTNKGEWLSLASQIAAEKVFFVDNDPVIVFHQAPDDEPQRLMEIFRQTWCMARPQLLFIAFPGGLEVYSLNQPPAQTVEEWESIEPLDVVRQVNEVSEKLQAYRREQIETRQLFEDDLGALEQRADKRLVLDLKHVRQQLLEVDPDVDPRHIHALIGRSIFIRYLEDRDILTPNYFLAIAQNQERPEWNQRWLDVLEEPGNDLAPNSASRRYSRVLRDKGLTYALFEQLAEHFNGDMFPQDPKEKEAITEHHLQLLRRFLLGDTDPQQQKLFLWAYDFRIIPLELISNIYEEFYHKSNAKDSGTHYTPSVLVEYVLSQVLTIQRLAQKPRILDFACGSAIFLVQAYRRIVRYQESQLGRPLTNQELRQILRDQIAGIEINEEAIHIAAFSLYLALLYYQEPKCILAQIAQTNGEKPLPYIILDTDHPQAQDSTHYNILYRGNAFDLMNSERALIEQRLDESSRFKGRIEWERLSELKSTLPFEPLSFDIIVGNPPWGSSSSHLAQEHALRWCDVFGWSIGDRELSQAFIARSLSLVKPDGECGLLVSAGVFLKRSKKSIEFRQRWLQNSTIEQLTNFIHVRDVFFSAVSPFCFVRYDAAPPPSDHFSEYWSAKKTETADSSQFVVLTLYDLHKVRQWELIHNDLLWKVYWWGNHRDATLIETFGIEDSLGQVTEDRNWSTGQGYTPGHVYPSGREIFAFTPDSFERLLDASIPPVVIKQVKVLRGREYKSEQAKATVLNDLEKALDTEGKLYIDQVLQETKDRLQNYNELNEFDRYAPLDDTCFVEVPSRVHRYGVFAVYNGWKLLVQRGITQANNNNGRIVARLEEGSFCFRNSVHGINLENAKDWERKTLVAVLWSSLARYFFFMTTSSWGPWHHEIHLEEGLLTLPIRFPDDRSLRERIVRIVDELRTWNPTKQNLFTPNGLPPSQVRAKREKLERQLDGAVFDLYELNEPERDLILDLCETGLEFFYREDKSAAIQKISLLDSSSRGTMADLPGARSEETGLQGYLYAFLQMWNPQLETIGGEFSWRIIRAPNAPMLAVIFTTQQMNTDSPILQSIDDGQAWYDLLEELGRTLSCPVSERIYIDGLIRAVTDTNIFVIKRDERRLWTRSIAREDAEATLLQAMIRQEVAQK